MGFFASRTPEDTTVPEHDGSMVRVIRSRFYGKYKGKQRETFVDVPPPHLLRVGGKPQKSVDQETLSPASPNRSSMRPLEVSVPRPAPRAHTDAITSTLAQRLNELATANAEGLLKSVPLNNLQQGIQQQGFLSHLMLSDEEYRLLRQNIFERLASGTPVPTETPVIPLSPHSRSLYEPPQLDPGAYSPRQFQSKPRRPPSVRSKSSVTSAVSNLFKRGSSRRISAASTQESAVSESSSLSPLGSLASGPFKRRIIPSNMRSVSPALGLDSPPDQSATSTQSRAGHRLLGSTSYQSISRNMRQLDMETPPSSFSIQNADPKHSPSIPTSDASPDDEKVKSSQDIRLDIEALEAEGRRVLDAFDGLELSTLTRSQQTPGHPPLPRSPSISAMNRWNGGEYSDSFLTAGGSASGRGTPFHGSDADGISLRSTTSYGTNVSQSRSHRPNPSLRASGTLVALSAANRKRSMSSLSSRARVPPSLVPALGHARLQELGSASSVNLVKLQGSMSTMDEDGEVTVLEAELFDIRRRRQEVTVRYQDRLEYLRAQLKGAQLREKLLRK